MAGLLDLLNSDIGKKLIDGASEETGASKDKTASVLSMGLPLLMGAMKKNASTPEGASGLLSALSSGKHDGSILDNIGGLLGGGADKGVLDDGAGILSHVLGGKQSTVENTLSAKSGLDAGSISKILKMAAPVLLGLLGKQKRENNIDNGNDLSSLLGSFLGGQPQENQSLIASLIDQDGDGSVLDDVADMVLGSKKKSGGLGGMLGGLFGK
ncbi:MAG: hypothetical protein CL868_20380 [Cytophagaceae bacterium]|nr:hypothetical protein [Cytophagaceae bacterium]|tara:strand:- start:165 stop:800 length:636 start_codon:yes stop_codon:yes gene_type:complete